MKYLDGPLKGQEVKHSGIRLPFRIVIPVAAEPLKEPRPFEFELDALGNVRPKRMKFGRLIYEKAEEGYKLVETIR